MAGGRPNVYDTKLKPYLQQIRVLRQAGTEYKVIAKMLNIAESSLYKHKAEIEEFTETIKNGEDELIVSLEKSLYNLALGTYKQVKTKTVYDADKTTVRSYEVSEEYGKPELGSIIFALTNRAPDTWKNKREENISFDNEDVIPAFADVIKKVRTDEANT